MPTNFQLSADEPLKCDKVEEIAKTSIKNFKSV